MTLTDIYSDRLKKIKPNAKIDLKAQDCTIAVIRAYYRAAKKHNIKISIRNSPDGMRVWRLS